MYTTTTKSNYTDHPELIDHLARISTASTLKFLSHKDQSNSQMMSHLRNTLQSDLKQADRQNNLIVEIGKFEKFQIILKNRREEIKSDQASIDQILDNIDVLDLSNASTIAKFERVTRNNNRYLKLIKLRLEEIARCLDDLYKVIIYSISDASDLFQEARLAITEAQRTEAIQNILDTLPQSATPEEQAEAVKTVIIAKIPLKTKDGKRTYTLKKWGDRAIQQYLNAQRRKIALKTQYIIEGYDEEGNELTIQCDKLTTLGGIEGIDRKIDFDIFVQSLNFSETDFIIIRYLMEGKTQEQTAKRIGISQQAVAKRIRNLRERLASIPYVATYLKK